MEFYDFPYIYIYLYPYIGNVIIPTDFHSIIFQRGRSTTNQTFVVGDVPIESPISSGFPATELMTPEGDS